MVEAGAPRRTHPRLLAFLILLGATLMISGCETSRSDNNPFIGTSGAAIESPYGDGEQATVDPYVGVRP
jgi:hypothetical protein